MEISLRWPCRKPAMFKKRTGEVNRSFLETCVQEVKTENGATEETSAFKLSCHRYILKQRSNKQQHHLTSSHVVP